MLQQDYADEAAEGGLVWRDADYTGVAFDFAIEALVCFGIGKTALTRSGSIADRSRWNEETGTKQVETSSAIHLAFDQLEFVDLPSICPFDHGSVRAALITARSVTIPFPNDASRLALASLTQVASASVSRTLKHAMEPLG